MCLAAGCSAHAEEPLISEFFAASRLRDKTALQAFSTVIFEPKEDGIVTRFTITGVSAEPPNGKPRTKNVTLEAPVKRPDGQTITKRIVVTMEQRAERWIITGVVAYQQ